MLDWLKVVALFALAGAFMTFVARTGPKLKDWEEGVVLILGMIALGALSAILGVMP